MTTDAFDTRDVLATKADLSAALAELKEEIGKLSDEIHQMEARLLRRMTGAVLAGIVASAAIARLG